MENNFNRFLDDVAGGVPSQIRDVLFESRQSTMGRALLADAIDVIPEVGPPRKSLGHPGLSVTSRTTWKIWTQVVSVNRNTATKLDISLGFIRNILKVS
jgi:hypothetical protein